MERVTLTICSRCRNSLARQSWSITRRFHAPAHSGSYSAPGSDFPSPRPTGVRARPRPFGKPTGLRPKSPPHGESPPRPISVEEIPKILRNRAPAWRKEKSTQTRLESWGVPHSECLALVDAFVSALQEGRAFDPQDYHQDVLHTLTERISKPDDIAAVDRLLTKVLYTWASNPRSEAELKDIASVGTLSGMRDLLKATDFSYPSEWFPQTRFSRRKIIMHVGPTNSGKTHTALRALAAARTGCYCGPLRLLAHEICERLNNGQIVPLGAEIEEEKVQPDPNTNIDVAGSAPVVIASGSSRYARSCNLITGESRKIVDEAAGLMSCTIEMANFHSEYDVAIVDEIQMVSDPDRGASWSLALLGLRARELHVCGEETAVPIVEAMVRETGDEFVVNRYERLTPLVVAEKSLEADLSRVRPGDCVVTFQRSNIFALKRQIETQTGLRCAIVYGRLPPETRNQQAALFNKRDSGYDVLIGSDAIGMGLNLRIKRIIFTAVHKFNGRALVPLSLSQMKQIAGRAGRYGLHEDPSAGGVVTTLHEKDLPILRETLAKPIPPLVTARVRGYGRQLLAIARALPNKFGLGTISDAELCLSTVRRPYELEVNRLSLKLLEFVDRAGEQLSLTERLELLLAPVPNRDEDSELFAMQLVRVYAEDGQVDLKRLLDGKQEMDALGQVIEMDRKGKPIRSAGDLLPRLESLDKALVIYIWLSYRNPVVFKDQELGNILKVQVEGAIDKCLQAMSLAKRALDTRVKDRRSYGDFSMIQTQETVEGRMHLPRRGGPTDKIPSSNFHSTTKKRSGGRRVEGDSAAVRTDDSLWTRVAPKVDNRLWATGKST